MKLRLNRGVAMLGSLILLAVIMLLSPPPVFDTDTPKVAGEETATVGSAYETLQQIPIKGRAPHTGYSRDQFGSGWNNTQGCTTREIILNRDLTNVVKNDRCQVVSGTLHDSYTGKVIEFQRGVNSAAIQIDHVVALGNAWQTGAQQLTPAERNSLANDPLELIAVDGSANQQKSDGDAATWLPSNKAFRCQYIARQIAVKQKYKLWVTRPEYEAMVRILGSCPGQQLPTP